MSKNLLLCGCPAVMSDLQKTYHIFYHGHHSNGLVHPSPYEVRTIPVPDSIREKVEWRIIFPQITSRMDELD